MMVEEDLPRPGNQAVDPEVGSTWANLGDPAKALGHKHGI